MVCWGGPRLRVCIVVREDNGGRDEDDDVGRGDEVMVGRIQGVAGVVGLGRVVLLCWSGLGNEEDAVVVNDGAAAIGAEFALLSVGAATNTPWRLETEDAGEARAAAESTDGTT